MSEIFHNGKFSQLRVRYPMVFSAAAVLGFYFVQNIPFSFQNAIVDAYPEIEFPALFAIGFGAVFLAMAIFLMALLPLAVKIKNRQISFPLIFRAIRLRVPRPRWKLFLAGVVFYLIFLLCEFMTYIFSMWALPGVITLTPPDIYWLLWGVIPGLGEEILFRGYVLTLFESSFSRKEAGIYSGFLFGIYHLLNLVGGGNLVLILLQVPFAFILGYVLAAISQKTSSLLPAILVHTFIDGISAPIFFFAFGGIAGGIGIFMVLVGFFLLPGALCLFFMEKIV